MSDSATQATLSMGFPSQEDWSGLSFPPPGDPPDPGIKPTSPALQADSLPAEPPGELIINLLICNIYRFYFLDQILADTDGNTMFPISM